MLNAKTHQEESGSAVEHGFIACKALNSVLGTESAKARASHYLLTSLIHDGLVGKMGEVGNAKTL